MFLPSMLYAIDPFIICKLISEISLYVSYILICKIINLRTFCEMIVECSYHMASSEILL